MDVELLVIQFSVELRVTLIDPLAIPERDTEMWK